MLRTLLCCVLTTSVILVSASKAGADACPPFAGHDENCPNRTCVENWADTPSSVITPQLAWLEWSKDEWNKTNEEVGWQITEILKTVHAWEVHAEVRTDLKAGVLAKIIADAKIGVTVGGSYSGSGEYTREVSVETTVVKCRGKGRREYIDKYSATVTQAWGSAKHTCVHPDGEGGYSVVTMVYNPEQYGSTGNGDNHQVGEFVDLGPYTQSQDPETACYEAE